MQSTKNDPDAKLFLVTCVPLSFCPTPPEGNSYKKSTCDLCGCEMWLGDKSAELVARGVAKECMPCAITTGKLKSVEQVHRLDKTQA